MQLGPFELVAPIAEGSSGRVWLGRHVHQRVEVAVKVLSGRGAADGRRRAAFLREVRAVARLYHPAVVQILDFGEVGSADGDEEAAGLARGTPWLVLPLARGSLARWPWAPDWNDVRAVLRQVLRGLAHAHARGVVHRDLKPGNLLVGDEDLPRGIRIADFGVALLADEPGDSPRVAGTLRYMAPEQIRGDLGRVGPWTDLYALGCLAWELVGGAAPFADARDIQTLAHRQLYGRPPRLEPRFPVPAGVESWLLRLLQKSVAERYVCAADALAGLDALGASDGLGPMARSFVGEPHDSASTLSLDTLEITEEGAPEPSLESPAPAGIPRLAPPGDEVGTASWDGAGDDATPDLPMALVGVGLRLYPLRDRPVVGRADERRRLVGALRDAVTERRMRLVLLEGAAGVGKSRLARWVSEWSVEQGHARAWTVFHGQGVADGVDGLLAALELPPEGPASARWERIRCALAATALARPVVLWLDDVQHGNDALGLVRHLAVCDRVEPFPLLVVMTAEREELVAAPGAAAALAQLTATAGLETIAVDVLLRGDRPLLTQILGLRPGRDALRIDDASRGSPMIAVRLVEHALATGGLVAGPEGFELSAGATLPADLGELWRVRVRGALAGADVEPVAVAGVLGELVDEAEWRATCLAAGATADRRGLDALIAAGLLHETDEGWRFSHGLARSAAEALSTRAAALHRAAAEAVPSAAPWRRARHLLAAGEDQAAIEPLLLAVRQLGEIGRLPEAEWLADRARACLERAPAEDVRHGRLLVLEASLCFRLGRTDQARLVVEALARGRARYGWPEVEGGAEYLAGDLAVLEGRFADAAAHLERSLAAAERDGDAMRSLGARTRQCHVWVAQGRLDEAAPALEHLVAEATRLGALVAASVNCSWLSTLACQRGDAVVALRWAGEAFARAQALGEQGALGHALCILGNACFLAGDRQGATEAWSESARRYGAIGSPQASIAQINLGTQRWRDGDRRAAERALTAARDVLLRVGQRAQALDAGFRLAAATSDAALRDSLLAEAEAGPEFIDASADEFLAEWMAEERDPEIRSRVAALIDR